jgi:hypothetical protein
VLEPRGIAWLTGGHGVEQLRCPARSLLVIGGPPGAGKSTLAARAVEGAEAIDPDAERAALAAERAIRASTGRSRSSVPERAGSCSAAHPVGSPVGCP